ncbi:MAG: ribosome maturation factor RimP [Actinomycetaceae bacterium]|nr:ribosome maturation factor RimP [Actinomycetaceae bacterium]
MSKKSVERQIEELVAPIVGARDLFLESVTVTAGKNPLVRVTVDLPEGPGAVDSDAINEVTKAISQALDEADPITHSYTLEVSTPGAERQLTTARHFSRTIGHLVEIRTHDGRRIKGRVLDATTTTVTVNTADGQKKQHDDAPTVVELDDVKKARSRVELRTV